MMQKIFDVCCTPKPQTIEFLACKLKDVAENEVKTVEVSNKYKVLLTKYQGKIYALGTNCSHYGAPLFKGVARNGLIRCPWHGACFNVKTGDIEDFPGWKGIPSYQVSIKKTNEVWVKGRLDIMEDNAIGANLTKPITVMNKKLFVVVGSGPAGFQCIISLRNLGFDGKVICITTDNFYPYDRTKLSKQINVKPQEIMLRSQTEYTKLNIEFVLSTSVTKVNTFEKTVSCNNGQVFHFDKLFLAPGARPRELKVEGCNLKGIYYLRNHTDHEAICEAVIDKNIAIIGTSFIGMEITVAMYGKVKSITLVGKSEYPIEQVLGSSIGRKIKQMFDSKNVKYIGRVGLIKFEGEDETINKVILTSGAITCDACIVCIGAVADTEFLKDSGIAMDDVGQIRVNDKMETNMKDVFAGGDAVIAPLEIFKVKAISLGHWQMAQFQGKIGAFSMLDKSCDTRSVPFFWTKIFDKNIRFCGLSAGYDNLVLNGSLDDWKFMMHYIRKGRVVAVCTVGYDPAATMFASLLLEGVWLTKEELVGEPPLWTLRFKT